MSQHTNLGLSRIGQIAVPVRDLDRAVGFYRDQLGMKFLFRAGTMAFFDAEGIRLMLVVPEKPEFSHPSSILYFKVDDIEQVSEILAARGVTFEAKPHVVAKLPTHDLWMGFFRDSENNLLALMSEPARK